MNWRNDLSRRLVLDNGSCFMRFGNANEGIKTTQLNLLAQLKRTGQLLSGNEELHSLLDESTVIKYIKPIVRGVLVNFDKEITLWEQLFGGRDLVGNSITLTHHPLTPEIVHSRTCEVLFEYFGFNAFMPLLSQKALLSYAQHKMNINGPCQMIIDSGHSATYIVPFMDNEVQSGCIKRIEVGGKLLTSYLKDTISLKYFEFKHFELLARQIKEDVCRVSVNYNQEIQQKEKLKKYFILPDYEIGQRGFATDKIDQGSMSPSIEFDKEIIRIPELIFTPSDIGINQKGLINSLCEAINLTNPDLKGYFLENIYIFGGNTRFQNFMERIQIDLRQEVDQSLDINIQHSDNINATFEGCILETSKQNFDENVINKMDYQERGFNNLYHIYY